MGKWIDLGLTEQYPDGEHVCTQAEEHPLVVCRVAGCFYVVANICPHAGLPLGEGDLAGLVLTCPFHGYAYNIRTGQNIDYPDTDVPVRRYETKVEAGRLWVNLEKAEAF